MTREEMLACLNDRPCSVCKFHTENGCGKWYCVFEEEPDDAENAGDLISRQAVLEAIEDDTRLGMYSRFASYNDAQCFKDVIRELPSVENKGEWIYQQGVIPYKWRCNKCEKMFKTDFNYCPNCGADMRGET